MILAVCPNPAIDVYAHLSTFKPATSNRIQHLTEYPGGKGVHVALALKEMGMAVELMGFWAGTHGEWVQSACNKLGVETSGVDLKGNTRKCYTFITEEKSWDHTELLEPGPRMGRESFEAFKKIFADKIKSVSQVIISGSWPADSPENACQELVRLCNQHHVDVILDCTGVQLKNALQEKVTALHLNESEFQETKMTFPKLLESVSILALTKGKDGLELLSSDKIVEGKVVLSKVISTVGSGDCLTAGLGYSLLKNTDMKEHARYAVAFGAANCLRHELGMLYKKDVDNLLSEIEIKEVNYAK
ncbi:fructose-1-phosphate kinase/fructose-6-phosphate kinase [Belliella baltica DSM 15883]|uniref:Fructose-1-phosphate kinase/fructose-6-phosphate kinase n=1 Tax=Belliella baltica (strain DSM 15883 / CIP 108006 / LMG 21964 / BA134) TaxID=866536 RepID=I3Z955_BELBD|nr:PfkB family carbohydrate kinase [Belliella baltica]AFL85773.1 fructose-1-phosphate kinase/fructose-6-phosphate kinase [Belliella baltica DSM 15883]